VQLKDELSRNQFREAIREAKGKVKPPPPTCPRKQARELVMWALKNKRPHIHLWANPQGPAKRAAEEVRKMGTNLKIIWVLP
jgi:hypothetical protein